MIVDQICSNNKDEYYTPQYAIFPIIKYLPPVWEGIRIWCPFDLDESNYPKLLRQAGYDVINTHIQTGTDFFLAEPPKGTTHIISNPPYSVKAKVLQRLFDLHIPFAMLLSIPGIFEGQHRFNLFKNNKFEIMYFNKRISYLLDYKTKKTATKPPFSSAYICSGILPQQIVFEEVDRSII